ncbi:hypothetical protein HPB48_013639 [Haemaphysalis longicornis]|uniref:Uncharacterized protein n=1 Tax=Haemaphysalis longicornis TaxID=44386 RepID=A0A9J6FCL0_HAELO|nr:hypothetical protein HPB48_013639 [Haemaphysalis longicornis]
MKQVNFTLPVHERNLRNSSFDLSRPLNAGYAVRILRYHRLKVLQGKENRRPAKAPGLKPSTKKPSLEAMDTSEPSSTSITPKDRHKPLERTNSQELIKKAELPKVSPTGKGSGS